MKDDFKNKYGPWALVAGAAEGLGESFAVTLAARGLNVVMIDRNDECMRNVAERIRREFPVNVICLNLDLAIGNAEEMIMDTIETIDCRLLVYNAAYSRVAPFLFQSLESIDQYIRVNCRTMIRLVHRFSGHLAGMGKGGGILIMSSLAGLIGSQLLAPYAATKAFGALLAESLSYELNPYHIDVLACLAGPTDTPGFRASAPRISGFIPRIHHPDFVAQRALDQLGKRILFIPGIYNRLGYAFLLRTMPRKLASKIVNGTIMKIYSDKLL